MQGAPSSVSIATVQASWQLASLRKDRMAKEPEKILESSDWLPRLAAQNGGRMHNAISRNSGRHRCASFFAMLLTGPDALYGCKRQANRFLRRELRLVRSILLGPLISLGLVGQAAAADLNAPIVDHPTVGSEIERGWRAAFECQLNGITDNSAVDDCVSAEGSRAQQEHTQAAPFLLGLYASQTFHYATRLKVDAANAATNSFAASEVDTDQRELAEVYKVYIQYRQQLHIADDQVVSTLSDLSDAGKRSAAEVLKTGRPAL